LFEAIFKANLGGRSTSISNPSVAPTHKIGQLPKSNTNGELEIVISNTVDDLSRATSAQG
jgi:hypothetical protein